MCLLSTRFRVPLIHFQCITTYFYPKLVQCCHHHTNPSLTAILMPISMLKDLHYTIRSLAVWLWRSTWLITAWNLLRTLIFFQVSPCAVQQTSFILHVLVSSMQRWISILSRGHSDYRLTGDLHAPLQRAEHVFILFFPHLSSVLLWPRAADTRVSKRAEHRRDKAGGALIIDGWHWWWEKVGTKWKRVRVKGRAVIKGTF